MLLAVSLHSGLGLALSGVGHMLFVPDISLWQWLADLVIVVGLLDAECRTTIKPLPGLTKNISSARRRITEQRQPLQF